MTYAVGAWPDSAVLRHALTALLHTDDALRLDERRQVDNVVLVPRIHSQVPEAADKEVLGGASTRPQVPW